MTVPIRRESKWPMRRWRKSACGAMSFTENGTMKSCLALTLLFPNNYLDSEVVVYAPGRPSSTGCEVAVAFLILSDVRSDGAPTLWTPEGLYLAPRECRWVDGPE